MDRPVTVITGTRKGIGRFLAGHFVAMGHIVIGCSRKATDYEDDHYVHRTLDVADEAEVKKLFGWVRRDLGRLDHLVNNAGIAAMNHSLLTPVSSIEAMLNTNVIGTFLFCREAAKVMKKRGFGRIVNFSTVAVPLKLAGEAGYAASKAAVETMTQVLAAELAEFGITVNAVGPSPVKTDLIGSIPDDKIEALLRKQAIPRIGTFEDVAHVVGFFLRPESGFITGQRIYLGGV